MQQQKVTMWNIKFTKIKNVNGAIRDDVIEGYCLSLPEVGRQFQFFTEGRDIKDSVRMVNTNEVVEITKLENEFALKTKSGSLYVVENLGEKNGS